MVSPQTPRDRFLKPAEAATLLGIEPKIVRRLVASGRLPAIQRGPSFIRVSEADVRRLREDLATHPFINLASEKPPSRRRFLSATVRATVWDKTNGACWYCRKAMHPLRDLTVDHVIPVCRGGTDDLDNLVPCCSSCNSKKSGRDGWVAA